LIRTLIISISLALPAATTQLSAPSELLDRAVRTYREALDGTDRDQRIEKFRQAEMLFSRLVEGDPPARNADLFTNLGNAALLAERPGHAILAYRRALELDPATRRARQNLEHARQQLPHWLPRPEEGGMLDTFLGGALIYSRRQRASAAAGLFLLAAFLVALSIRSDHTLPRNLALIPLTVWLLVIGTLLVDRTSAPADAAVITVADVVARAADSIQAPARFSEPLPAGAEVRIIEDRDPWSHIQLADGRDAWVLRSSFERIQDF